MSLGTGSMEFFSDEKYKNVFRLVLRKKRTLKTKNVYD